MSEQERIDMYKRLGEAMKRSTQAMLDRKKKLGETVIIADPNGMPLEISAEEAIRIINLKNLPGEETL